MSSRVVEDEQFSCPSFSSYSVNNLAEIAEKVSAESVPTEGDEENNDGDDDFEFTFWAASSGDVNARIFPVFNRRLLDDEDDAPPRVVVPLSILLEKEKSLHGDDSSSSSEADEIENVPSGTYCAWRPNKCKKSPSAGSASSRWAALRDLMRRSNSEGMKDKLVFLSLRKKKKSTEDRKVKAEKNTITTKKGPSSSSSLSSAHEDFYVRSRAVKEGDKKKSYLPYRKELVGIFLSGNGFLPHL